MDKVDYVNSTGIGIITGIYSSITNAGGRLKICNANSKVSKIMMITKLLEVFDSYYEEDEALKELLDRPISFLELSVRASNCLESENISTIRDLCRYSEDEVLNIRNFGSTSLDELKEKLQALNLTLGMVPKSVDNGKLY